MYYSSSVATKAIVDNLGAVLGIKVFGDNFFSRKCWSIE